MAKKPPPKRIDKLEIGLDILQAKLARHDPAASAVADELERLRRIDPLAELVTRHITELYFPGAQGIARKEKAARMMLAAFFMLHETRTAMHRFNMTAFTAELDSLLRRGRTSITSSDDDGAGSPPSDAPLPGSSSPRPRKH